LQTKSLGRLTPPASPEFTRPGGARLSEALRAKAAQHGKEKEKVPEGSKAIERLKTTRHSMIS